MKATGIQLGKSARTGDATRTRALPISRRPAIAKRMGAAILACGCLSLATPAAMALTLSQYPLFIGSVTLADVLLIVDDSNSMDEAPTGMVAACDTSNRCGSASDYSKSQIARTAAQSLITTYMNKINLGLMSYQQYTSGSYKVTSTYVSQGFYDVSYNPSNLNPTLATTLNSQYKTSTYTISGGSPLYYNLALPVYGFNNPSAFCYTAGNSTPFGNLGSTAPGYYYRCFKSFTGNSDTLPTWPTTSLPKGPGSATASEIAAGYASGTLIYYDKFVATDSDIASGVNDYGKQLAWYYVGPTWFSDASPGMGYLHVPIQPLNAAQAALLNKKLARAQFVTNGPTTATLPLQNAGNTPIQGTLETAKNYFLGTLSSATQGGPQAAPPNSCSHNYAVLLTDGLPDTNDQGVNDTVPATALTHATTAAAAMLASSAGVETYVLGFGLPNSPLSSPLANATALNSLATAGGTGTAYSATDTTTLNAALSTIFSDILAKTGSAASVATNSTNVQTQSRVYQAKFSSADWSGQLLQYKLDNITTAEWDAGSKINAQAATSRVVITKGATGGVAFQWGNLTSTPTTGQQALLNKNASGTTDSLGSSRVAYLRGDASNEGTAAGNFRARTVSKLGDIVNSNPWYVGPPAAGYSDVDYPGYNTFRSGLLNRKPVVYVGANDGLLHGFDASLDFSTVAAGVPTTSAGNEVLGYVPANVYPNLSWLTDLTYNQNQNHRYFVDGSPMTADVVLGTTWHTVLIGALNGGGKGYYALDITNPSNFSETNAATMLLWEFTDSDDADVGFAYNYPPDQGNGQARQIVRMANGKWAVILGNGYNSTNGKAVLYVLFINDGISGWAGNFVKITVDATGSNGLSTPVPFDSNGDGSVDTVYAGDLKGNLWKFLVGPNAGDATVTSDPSTWKVAFSTTGCGTTTCTPLFQATDSSGTAQPIIWPPEVTLSPAGGQEVMFGTGKYLESGDNTASIGTQTFYGIQDTGTTVSGRSVLSPVSITTTTVGTTTYRSSATPTGCGPTSAPPCPATPHGWYADLPTAGERMTGIPKVDSGTVFFNTFIPSTTACTSGGTGWLMGLNYLTGTTPAAAIFDTNGNGVIDSNDTKVAGDQIGAALGGTTLIKSSIPGGTGVGVSSLATGQLVETAMNLGTGTRGRISWREIVQ